MPTNEQRQEVQAAQASQIWGAAMNEQLKPCPCCGAAAEIKESKTHDYTVKCTNASCGMSTKKCHENVNGAVAIWNARVQQ